MSNSHNKPKSCTGRLFGTLFAFIAAAVVVYAGSYLVLFHITGLPAANESGWLGPKLRFLATGPYEDGEGGSFYKGDTRPYEVFDPLNDLWLKTKDLPTTTPVAASEQPGAGGRGDDGDGEGRRGRGRRSAGQGVNERLDDGVTTGSETGEDAQLTTGTFMGGSEAGERPRRRGNFRRGNAPADDATTQTAREAEAAPDSDDAGETPRRRGGRRSAPQPE